MKLQLLGKFYDNHSLSIVNRKLALSLSKITKSISIFPLDEVTVNTKVSPAELKELEKLKSNLDDKVDIQIRHSYPPVWAYPENKETKVVYIQPWEYSKIPSEWQYKFENFADGVIVPSNFIANVIKNAGINPKRLFVIPNGYDSNIFNLEDKQSSIDLGVNPDKVNFVYIGNPQWRKGLDILINVWSKSFKSFDNVNLIIIDNSEIYGKSNVLEEILKVQYNTECGTIVYSDKTLTELEIASLYKDCDYIVHPYRAEGFAMHIQEAMACGCVPIVSKNGPTDEFVPDSSSFKIDVQRQSINILDKALFIAKPGDSFSNMSSHTFVNEPIGQSLHDCLKTAYHMKAEKPKLDTSLLNTWDEVAKKYMEAFLKVDVFPIKR